MEDLVFTKKTCNQTFGISDAKYNFELQKPMLCPICGAYQDGTVVNKCLYPLDNDIQYGNVCYRCTHCQKLYLVSYYVSANNKIAKFGAYFPPKTITYENDVLNGISPRFIDAYNQALRSETCGDIELAAVGFRQALECLIKDFAINEQGADREEVVKKKLCNAISDYLGEKDLVATADVIRILGNDYAHYDRKYPEHDFALLKRYMEIFIKLVETKVLIAHPPVERK